MRLPRLIPSTFAALALAACGTPADGTCKDDPATTHDECDTGHDDKPVQCEGTEYTAFDATHHAPQDARLAAFKGMLDDIAAAKADPTQAAAKFAAVLAKYDDASHQLGAKVKGRKDDHFADGSEFRTAGVAMDATIREGIALGAAATTADEVGLAKQLIEKTLVRFFYLSTFHELLLGEKEKLDEAFGYYGSGRTNDAAAAQGIALVLHKRDTDNGTTLAADAFQALLDASCAMATAFHDGKTEPLVLAEVPDYKAAVDTMDAKMQLGLAYSAARYFHSPDDARGDRFKKIADAKGEPAAFATLVEGEMYFNAVEPYLLSAGGDRKAAAEFTRTQIEAAKAKHEADDATWVDDIADEEIFDKLEAAFGIDVKKGG